MSQIDITNTFDFYHTYSATVKGSPDIIRAGYENLRSLTAAQIIDGSPVAGYRGKIKRGENAIGPYKRSGSNIERTPGSVSFSSRNKDPIDGSLLYGSSSGYFGSLPLQSDLDTPLIINPSLEHEAQTKAATKLYNSANGLIQKAYSGETLGELKQGWDLMKNPIKSLLNGYTRFTKINRAKLASAKTEKHLKNILRSVGDSWITYKFGIQPLFQTAVDVGEACASLVIGQNGLFRVNGNSSARDEDVRSREGVGPVGGFAINAKIAEEIVYYTQSRYAYTGGVLIDTPLYDYDRARRAFGLSWNEFIPTLWELTPWSFLVDYYVNVGDLIYNACRPKPKWVFLAESIKHESGVKMSSRYSSSIDSDESHGYTCYGKGPTTDAKSFEFTRRDITSSPPVITLDFKIPNLHSTRWITQAALVAGRIR